MTENILLEAMILIAVCGALFCDLSDFNEENDKSITEYTIRAISEHYSRENQLEKCKEELKELLEELEHAEIINGKMVLPWNTWSECADVIIMVSQIAMQHEKEDAVKEQMEYKLERQLGRMEDRYRVRKK